MKPQPQMQMSKVIAKLSGDDQNICCFMLKQKSPRHAMIHRGLLPFVSIKQVLLVLEDEDSRRLKQLAAKISEAAPEWQKDWPETTGRLIRLNDAKVVRHFGTHPERGKPMPWLGTQRRTAGIKWSQFQKAWVPNPLDVAPTVTLTKHAPGVWCIGCDPKHLAKVSMWLSDNCV